MAETVVNLVKYDINDSEIATAKARCANLVCDTPKGYEEVRLAIANIRLKRVAIEKRRVELKADALAYGRKVDFEAKRLTVLLLDIEEPLQAKKDAVDAEKERVRAEIEAAKIAALEAVARANREREEAELRAVREAEEVRLTKEREQLEADRRAAAEERRIADEAARAEREASEARLRAERAELEEVRRKADEAARAEQERVRLEREAHEAAMRQERERLADERARAERAEFERLARIRADEDAKAHLEAERIATAEREARIAAVLPDAKKLDTFAAQIRTLQAPTVKSKHAKETLAIAVKGLASIADALTGIERTVAK